jgi:hypothetical protein
MPKAWAVFKYLIYGRKLGYLDGKKNIKIVRAIFLLAPLLSLQRQ